MSKYRDGMDHELYAYSALPWRPKLVWPDQAAIAFVPIIHFEHLEYVTPPGTVRDPRWAGRAQPDLRAYAWWEYGNRVAIFRILDLLDRHGLRATVATNAMAAERYPYLVHAFRERGYEFAARGLSANGVVSNALSAAEERALLSQSIERLERTTGVRPTGWFGQDISESSRTPVLLAELGLNYVGDWPNDDQPYRMSMAQDFLSIPYQFEWDDMRMLWDRRLQMPRYLDIVRSAFDQLHKEGAETGRFFGLPMHPWLIGAPHRIRYLEAAVDHISAAPRVWRTTAGDVTRYILSTASGQAAR